MKAQHFDRLARVLSTTPTRRRLFAGVAGSALGTLLALRGLEDVGASHVACRHVGETCSRNGECCSSRCKRGKCRAHNTLGCTVGPFVGICSTGTCGTGCSCKNTTGKAGFCGGGSVLCDLGSCTTDKECARRTGVPGSACVECPSCPNAKKTACVTPCTTP
jgi:hypothetical protein